MAYAEAAAQHAETSRRYLLRPDGASYHTFFFDQATGEPLGPRTHQGYAHDSLWARGQGWAIYGFALAAEWTAPSCSEAEYLEAARRAARRFLAELPPDGVPTWDLRLPEGAPRYPDSSAGAIAAAGLLRLARLEGATGGAKFRAAALRLLEALVAGCLENEPEAQGLLRHGTYHAHKGLGVDAYFICGDYFFLEALLGIEGGAVDFWGRGASST
ncbi:MAG: glycoside hydrolase family 88 protein [Anaerolineae bacterium]